MQDIYPTPCQALGFGLKFRQPFLCSLQIIIFHVRLSVTCLFICNAISIGRIVLKQKRLVLNGSGFGLRATVRSGASVPSWLFLERGAALSAGSAVFEGTPAPLISPGTPRCERAPSPGSPHCEFLFLSLRSPHSVKRRGTSSISPVRNVNRRFNQTLRLLPPCHLLYTTLLPTKYLCLLLILSLLFWLCHSYSLMCFPLKMGLVPVLFSVIRTSLQAECVSVRQKHTFPTVSGTGRCIKMIFCSLLHQSGALLSSPAESGRIKACVSAVQRDVCFNRVSESMLIDTVTVGSVCLKLSGGQMDWGGRVRGAVQNRPHAPSLISAPVESFSTFTELLMLSCRTIKGGER